MKINTLLKTQTLIYFGIIIIIIIIILYILNKNNIEYFYQNVFGNWDWVGQIHCWGCAIGEGFLSNKDSSNQNNITIINKNGKYSIKGIPQDDVVIISTKLYYYLKGGILPDHLVKGLLENNKGMLPGKDKSKNIPIYNINSSTPKKDKDKFINDSKNIFTNKKLPLGN